MAGFRFIHTWRSTSPSERHGNLTHRLWQVARSDTYRAGVKTPLQQKLGVAVRAHRIELELSQEEFADVVGMHPTYVSNMENGRYNVSLQNLERIATALQIPLSSLIAEAELRVRLENEPDEPEKKRRPRPRP